MSSVALPFTLVETSKFRLGHRPALDGIRGLAIIVVVLNHLDHIVPGFLKYFGGGYLGVDLFFVLSGFLITSLLIEEHDEAGRVILHVTLDSSRLTDLFENPILVWLGKRSYGLYVWHFPIYFLISKLNKPWLAPVAVALAVVTAWSSYRFIESPFLRIKARFKPQTT